MPCYEVRTVSVEFKVGNVDLLKKAIAQMGWKVIQDSAEYIVIKDKGYNSFVINLRDSKVACTMRDFDEKKLTGVSNQIKRAYSEQVIDEVAKRQKWMKKKLGENRFQLQRF